MDDAFESMATVEHGFPLDWYGEHKTLDMYFRGTERIVAYCAEEVRRQQDTPWHVFRMYRAWMTAQSLHYMNKKLNHAVIRQLGAEIDELAEEGYREYPIWVGGERKLDHSIHADMSKLLTMQGSLTPDDFYFRFEDIHPFGDGNGRTGKIIYNWLNGTLDDPVWPHNFWEISNP